MHHPQGEAPERYLVKILLSSMKAHLPHGQEEEDEDENDWGLTSVSYNKILGTANLIFKFWKVSNRERICKVKIKCPLPILVYRKKEQNVCVICSFRVMSY